MTTRLAAALTLACGVACSGPGEPDPNLPDYPAQDDAAVAATAEPVDNELLASTTDRTLGLVVTEPQSFTVVPARLK